MTQTQTAYVFAPPPTYSLPIRGSQSRFPIQRLFFVGRNYHAHAAEMGHPAVNKSAEVPFYFTKSPSALVESGATIAYPSGTQNYQHEIELVLALGAGGADVSAASADKLIYGYACGLDMTRRDLQFKARDKGRPWDLGKDFEQSAVVSEITPNQGRLLDAGAITLSVNGAVRQSSDISQLIWSIPEIIADLSRFYRLRAGDLIFTGTPEGVAPVSPGDHLEGAIQGVGEIQLTIAPSL